MTNWENIRQEWETTDITFVDLAEKHNIKTSTVRSRKNREKWQRGIPNIKSAAKNPKIHRDYNGNKVCTTCNKELPATPEHFHRDNRVQSGLRANCKECCKKQRKLSYAKNRELLIKQAKRWRAKNGAEWREENRKLLNKRGQERRAKKKRLPHTLTVEQWTNTKKYFNDSCAYCGISEQEHREKYEQVLHQEHIIPLSKGGGYTKNNIIPSCHRCNASKGDGYLNDWYHTQEYYTNKRENKILEFIESLKEEGVS